MKLYLAGTYAEIWNGGGVSTACWFRNGVLLTKLYLAGDGGPMTWVFLSNGGGFDLDVASRVNLLESFYYVADWQTRNIHRFKSFLLDSGGFTLRRGKGNVPSWNEYLDSYIRYINDNDVKLFFDLDIDEEVGYDNVVIMRKKLERETGKQSIPVWHESYGKQEWFNLCDEYDYVALGGLALAAGRRRMEKYVPWFLDEAHKRGTRVHVLGYTPADGKLVGSSIDSCDSTAWLYGNRGGFVYHWDGKEMHKFNKPKGKRLDGKKVARHNFLQWVKMSEYLEGR